MVCSAPAIDEIEGGTDVREEVVVARVHDFAAFELECLSVPVLATGVREDHLCQAEMYAERVTHISRQRTELSGQGRQYVRQDDLAELECDQGDAERVVLEAPVLEELGYGPVQTLHALRIVREVLAGLQVQDVAKDEDLRSRDVVHQADLVRLGDTSTSLLEADSDRLHLTLLQESDSAESEQGVAGDLIHRRTEVIRANSTLRIEAGLDHIRREAFPAPGGRGDDA